MSQPKHRKQKTYPLKLTMFELVHLRDLFGVLLPLDLKQTVSQALATSENRVMVEAKLWQKIAASCTNAGVPMDDDAPDFICAAASAPPVGIFRLAQEPNEGEEEDDDDDEGSVFCDKDDDDESENDESESMKPTKKECLTCGSSPRTSKCPLKCGKSR